MYRLQLVCWMWNCVIVTYIQVRVGVWTCNCVIVTYVQVTVGVQNVELCNCDICTGYSWCAECVIVTYVQVTVGVLNVELWHMYRLQLVCWMWNCVIVTYVQVTVGVLNVELCNSVSISGFGSTKCQWCFGRNILRCTEIVRNLVCECDNIRYSPPC